jgi:diguanylate cyclase
MPVSLSVGIHQADANSGYLDSASLIRCADDKMYAVKKQYKLKGK